MPQRGKTSPAGCLTSTDAASFECHEPAKPGRKLDRRFVDEIRPALHKADGADAEPKRDGERFILLKHN